LSEPTNVSVLHAGVGGRLRVDARVDDDDRDLRVLRLDQRRHDLARAARRDDERLDAGLDQVLDDLHLLLDVDLALGRLHLQRHAEAIGRFLRAAAHVDEERVVQRLEHERHRRLAALRPARRGCRATPPHGEIDAIGIDSRTGPADHVDVAHLDPPKRTATSCFRFRPCPAARRRR
jgi:hypothetical protein